MFVLHQFICLQIGFILFVEERKSINFHFLPNRGLKYQYEIIFLVLKIFCALMNTRIT